MTVIYRRRHVSKLYTAVAGHIVRMNDVKARAMIDLGIVEEYKGEFPPKKKTKIELKNL